jgi:predicted DNA-binding transcriptional regulator YafY
VAVRAVPDKNFEVVAKALLLRERLEITYYGRGRDESSKREVSPQLLIHYRGNWYLAAWCHKQKGMRSFAMDAIQQATVFSKKTTKTISKRELDSFVGQGYGIFSGATVQWATLRFSAERARWVSRELWHPLQRSAKDDDGTLLLELPFTDMRELSMDILRHGRHVEVVEPPELRLAVQAELQQALSQYRSED